jgi:putative aldouronate transport system permease protein
MVTQVGQSSQEALADAESAVVLPEAVRAAMTMITVVPIVLVYPFVQRYFVTGLIVGGLKG